MIPAGSLDRRVTFLRRWLETRASGELRERFEDRGVGAWRPVANAWAQRRDGTGRESTTDGVEIATRPAVFRVRYRADLTTADRLRDGRGDGDPVYEILSIAEIGRREGLDLVCQRVPTSR